MIKSTKFVPALSLAALLVSSVTHAENSPEKTDVLLIGGGIMSASLGTLLEELQPGWKQIMVEKLDGVALESSNGWNNAGTGHSANMELNYTPERADGSIDVTKALEINEAFMISRQFWSSQVKDGVLNNPRSFINSTPHMSFVWGDNVDYLTKRYAAFAENRPVPGYAVLHRSQTDCAVGTSGDGRSRPSTKSGCNLDACRDRR